MEQGHILVGNGNWGWLHATIDRADIVVRGTLATWFGGDADTEDNGETASGILTKGHPELRACSLPMSGFKRVQSTAGSPIPRLPWNTMVQVWCAKTNLVIVVPVIDLGPSGYTHHGLDLTVAAFEALGVPRRAGVMSVDYRIINGALLAGYITEDEAVKYSAKPTRTSSPLSPGTK